MSLIKPEDLKTELYDEVISKITRFRPSDEETINKELQQHINDAEAFIKSFLFKYDLNKLFSEVPSNPPLEIDALKKCIKVCAGWFLIRKANPNINYDAWKGDFMFWIGDESEPGWIYSIREGKINPSWPYPEDNPETTENEEQGDVYWTSTKQRVNRF